MTAATPRVRRGPHEPMFYCWVLLSIHVLVWVCVGRFSVSRKVIGVNIPRAELAEAVLIGPYGYARRGTWPFSYIR